MSKLHISWNKVFKGTQDPPRVFSCRLEPDWASLLFILFIGSLVTPCAFCHCEEFSKYSLQLLFNPTHVVSRKPSSEAPAWPGGRGQSRKLLRLRQSSGSGSRPFRMPPWAFGAWTVPPAVRCGRVDGAGGWSQSSESVSAAGRVTLGHESVYSFWLFVLAPCWMSSHSRPVSLHRRLGGEHYLLAPCCTSEHRGSERAKDLSPQKFLVRLATDPLKRSGRYFTSKYSPQCWLFCLLLRQWRRSSR